MPDAQPIIVTVSQLNQYVQSSIRSDPLLRSLRLRGQISGFKQYPSAWYFDLKDENALINCVMFRTQAARMSFIPRNGDQVILHGRVDLYQQKGQYQFYADSMRPDGVGDLWQRFEALKQRLQAEGLFDADRKRPLPQFPRRIAVVTSESGAVLHDICRVARERDPGVALVLVPTPVQGEEAAPQIAEAILLAGTLTDVDLVILGRGGGSMEDLWCFNEEIVARAISACKVPVISAVGHETDYTIADFTADKRAATPSNAAEIAIPDLTDMLAGLRMIQDRMTRTMQLRLEGARMMTERAHRRIVNLAPDTRLAGMQSKLIGLQSRLSAAVQATLNAYKPRLAMASVRLDSSADRMMRVFQEKLKLQQSRMDALSPLRVLERGYALVTADQRLISRAEDAPDRMTLHFADGSIHVIREEECEHGVTKEGIL